MIIEAANFDISKIKLIIWDLDNTFWNGTISEEAVKISPRNIELVKELSKRGIVNSICSKNEFSVCKEFLWKIGVWEYFVFPSIDWTPKSERVHAIISDMQLRPANVLFLDDEPSNLQRALQKSEQLLCGTAAELCEALWSQLATLPVDVEFRRLKQYQELQEKVSTKRNFASDEEFLRISDIRVAIGYDCEKEKDRIHELINRTNQLNYTKKRRTLDEVSELLQDHRYKCGYISCKDKFCDYGIVGFFALNQADNELEHYLFSCRTIGMGVEQFVYSYLSFPNLTIVGDVVTLLDMNSRPDWITLEDSAVEKEQQNQAATVSVLVKGPCDVSQIIPFFSNDAAFDTEFAYVSTEKEGMFIESFNHTSQILLSLNSTEEERKELIEAVPFIDKEYFATNIFAKDYDYIIFSLLTDYGLGLYRKKDNPAMIVAFGQYTVDYTDAKNWSNVADIWLADRPSREVV